jgi:hypothetical protein
MDKEIQKKHEKIFQFNEMMPEVLRASINIVIVFALIFVIASAIMFFIRTWF